MDQSRRSSSTFRVALFVIACAIALAAAGPLCGRLPMVWQPAAIGAIAGAFALLLSMLFTRWEGIHLRNIGAAIELRSIPRFAIGFLLGLVLVMLQALTVRAAGHIYWVRAPNITLMPIAPVLLGYLLLACREELAFHGYPLRRLDMLFGPLVAQFAIALLFAMEHRLGGLTWSNAVASGVGSLLFGMASLATRGLAVPIGLHAAWNFGQWMVGEKEARGIWTAVVEQNYSTAIERAGLIGYLIVFGVATCAFWAWYRKTQTSLSRLSAAEVSMK